MHSMAGYNLKKAGTILSLIIEYSIKHDGNIDTSQYGQTPRAAL